MATQTTLTEGGGNLAPLSPTQPQNQTTGSVGIGGLLGTGTFTPSLTGGAAAPSEASGDLSNRPSINIAPVGVNLGAILQPFNQGAPENGGQGLELMSRYVQSTSMPQVAGKSQAPNMGMLIAAAGGLMLLFVIVRTRKRS